MKKKKLTNVRRPVIHKEEPRRELSPRERSRRLKPVRAFLGLSGKPYPITIVEGSQKPNLQGTAYHWETRSGRRVWYPSAYNRKALSSPAVYVASTLRIVVGRDWLAEQGIEL